MQKSLYSIYHTKVGGEDCLIYSDGEALKLPSGKIEGLHYHNRCEIGICTCGNGIWVVGEKTYALSRDDIVIIPAGVPHYSRGIKTSDLPDCKCRFFYFDEQKLFNYASIPSDISISELSAFLPTVITQHRYKTLHFLLNSMIQAIMNICSQKNPESADIDYKISAHWYSLFLLELKRRGFRNGKEITEKTPEQNTAFTPALRKISLEFSENITLGELADSCSISVSYFSAGFKKAYGYSPIQYLNRFRAGIAAQLLAESDIKIIDICEFVGFSAPSELYRHFVTVYGMSPREYRLHRGIKPRRENSRFYS